MIESRSSDRVRETKFRTAPYFYLSTYVGAHNIKNILLSVLSKDTYIPTNVYRKKELYLCFDITNVVRNK